MPVLVEQSVGESVLVPHGRDSEALAIDTVRGSERAAAKWGKPAMMWSSMTLLPVAFRASPVVGD